MSDTKKLRQALKDAGFCPDKNWRDMVFNDKAKDGTRRLKLWDGNGIFNAPQHAQQELERQLKKQFAGRYLYGMFIRANDWRGGWYSENKSFIVRLVA